MYCVKENKCLEEISIIRFQETLEMEAEDTQTRIFRHDKITADSAVIVNFSGTVYHDVTFDASVTDGAVLVTVKNTGNDFFPLTYNVTVI
ncbi:MAG: hypothetical protein K2K06_06755 [Oscillospiraceae bacterium]|nr:hypothetical protein [Oscillospiraceae bacterium]